MDLVGVVAVIATLLALYSVTQSPRSPLAWAALLLGLVAIAITFHFPFHLR